VRKLSNWLLEGYKNSLSLEGKNMYFQEGVLRRIFGHKREEVTGA